MNRKVMVSLFALANLAFVSSGLASVFATITVTCPVTSGDAPNQLRNIANSYIAGNGTQSVDIGSGPVNTSVAFRSTSALPQGTPGDLSTYSSQTTNFNDSNPSIPLIHCNYSSTTPGFPNITVTYALLNGFGGIVSASTDNSVTLSVPVGFKA